MLPKFIIMHSVPMSLLCIAWKNSLICAQFSTLAWAACADMSNAAKNEVLSSSRETINTSLAEMDNRKLANFLQNTFSPHFSAFVVSYAAAPKKCTSLPEQSVTLVPSTPRACKLTSLRYMKTNFFKKTVNVVRKSIV